MSCDPDVYTAEPLHGGFSGFNDDELGEVQQIAVNASVWTDSYAVLNPPEESRSYSSI